MPIETAMGQTVTVSYRMPKVLFDRATRYAQAVYQPNAVIFRLALADFLDTHDLPERTPSSLSVIFPPVNRPDRADEPPQPVATTALPDTSVIPVSPSPYMEGVTGEEN